MKTLIAYYSNTGNNKFLAEELAGRLSADLEEIRPRPAKRLILPLALMRMPVRIHDFKNNPAEYDQVVMVGPIWTGAFIAPLRAFVRKYRSVMKQFYFATCCGSQDEEKDGKFGYETVFEKVRKEAGPVLKDCRAFPIALLVPEGNREDNEAMMNARLGEHNFEGEIRERVEAFAGEINHEALAVEALFL